MNCIDWDFVDGKYYWEENYTPLSSRVICRGNCGECMNLRRLLCKDNLMEVALWEFVDGLDVIPIPRVLRKRLFLFFMHIFINS